MRRRSNNEGCIYQRSDGRWVVQITLQGKLRQFYFKSNDAAVEHLKELHRQQVVGKNIAASDEPFGVYLARWLTETKSRSSSMAYKTLRSTTEYPSCSLRWS